MKKYRLSFGGAVVSFSFLCARKFSGCHHLNSITTIEQTTKFSSAIFQKMLSQSYIILRIQRLEGKQCGSR